MKLDKAIRLMNEDYQDYKQFLGIGARPVAECYRDRVASLLDYVKFRLDDGCPDLEAYERKAGKAIRKYAQEQARKAVEDLIPQVDTCPF
jgi:hypothetical protein